MDKILQSQSRSLDQLGVVYEECVYGTATIIAQLECDIVVVSDHVWSVGDILGRCLHCDCVALKNSSCL